MTTELRLLDVQDTASNQRALIETTQRTSDDTVLSRSIRDVDSSTQLQVGDPASAVERVYSAPRIVDANTVEITNPTTGEVVTLTRNQPVVTEQQAVALPAPTRTSLSEVERPESTGRLTDEQATPNTYDAQSGAYGVATYDETPATEETSEPSPGLLQRLYRFMFGWL